jgi:rRNA maturation RNase YbeY
MSDTLTVSNRQRRFPVDLPELKRMCNELKLGVFADLAKEPPAQLDVDSLEDMSERGIFSLVLVSNHQIQKLNKEWMDKDRPTDVLSFPLSLEAPPSVELPWEVGEIIISVEKADEQARSFGHGLQREMAFLFVHGMLHVLGFDHIEPADEKDMFGRQKRILDRAGFKR